MGSEADRGKMETAKIKITWLATKIGRDFYLLVFLQLDSGIWRPRVTREPDGYLQSHLHSFRSYLLSVSWHFMMMMMILFPIIPYIPA